MSEESETDTGGGVPGGTQQLATEIRVQVWGLRAKVREYKEAISVARAADPREHDPKDGEP